MSRRRKMLRAASVGVAILNIFPPSRALAGAPPTDYEQYVLELMNRARQNPDGEVYRLSTVTWGNDGAPATPDLNEGPPSSPISDASMQPLAFNTNLIQAARDYSTLLLNDNKFQHDYQKTTPQQMTAAGYTLSGNYGWGQNLAVTTSSGAFPINQANANQHHTNLFVDGNVAGRGHRENILNPAWKEVGIGFAAKSGYTYFGTPSNAILSTYDFAYSGAAGSNNPFITGVVSTDAVSNNNFYDVGEGLSGITVTATPTAGGASITTTTFSSGGYTLSAPAGSYNVTFSGAGLPSSITYNNVAVSNTNIKLDASADMSVWANPAGGNWSTPANWTGAAAPNSNSANTVFAGSITAPTTVTLDANRATGTLTFLSSQPYTIAGSARLSISLPTGTRIDVLMGSHTISAPLLYGTMSINALTAANSLTLSGAIAGGGKITKLGKGTLIFSSEGNNYDGGLFVNDGIVLARSSKALGVGVGTTLGWGSNNVSLLADTPGIAIDRTITVASGAGQRNLGSSLTSGAATFSGAITLQKDVQIQSAPGGAVSFTGGIGDGTNVAGLTKLGAGAVTLAGANTYHGNTTVSAGTLVLAGSVTNSASLIVTAGTVQFTADQTLKSLDVQKSQAGTQSLDLNNHSLKILASDLNAARASFALQIASTGVDGIYDSTSNANTAVGYTIISNSYLRARKTLLGDANVDGTVNFNDLVSLAQNYNTSGKLWDQGDFNRDGKVDFNDLVGLAQNYNTSMPGAPFAAPAGDFSHDVNAAFASVPEPGSGCLLAGAGALAAAARRRKR